ncbi:S46 family peptidase [Oligoflexus tunisiensis]|uniref:S46 family peptidase n=1 Tax=Oligoflexus tunisiensis TaxID=708132 RepID=UPI000A8F9092|nr:S46 family peptidase [Oligoflexus tunisiensis]
MKKFRNPLLVLVLGGLTGSGAYAVEGMWQPEQLPLIEKDLKAKGLAIKPENLNDLTAFPMNAIVSLGGCSASFVSDLGLVLTNHHCAYGSIQFNSSPERNLLENGFYANTMADELPAAPGARVFVTESIQDVTKDILKGLDKTTGLKRYEAIEKRRKDLITACEKTPGYRCRIDSFLGDSSYRLTRQLEIKDVRLVQAPPSAIGKFGGDIDNWMWPRHTGDFSFYRAYVDKKGLPAEYSKDNVPYKPKGYLKVDTKGVNEGSFVMVAGYPGRTNRHRLASEVEFYFDESSPQTKDYLDRRIALIQDFKAKDPELGIKYAAQLAGLSNASKNIEGKQKGYEAMGLLKQKKAEEKALLDYFKTAKNKQALQNLTALNKLLDEEHAADRFSLVLRKAGDSDLLKTASRLYRLAREKEKPDAQREAGYQDRDLAMMKQNLQAMTRRFDPKVDQALWELGLSDAQKAKAEFKKRIPKALQELVNMDAAAQKKALADYYAKSILGDEKQRLDLMNANRKAFEASKDPFIQLAVALYDDSIKLENENKDRAGRFQQVRSQYMQNLAAYKAKQGEVLYSDANSTLRITYGTVQGYKNRAGVELPSFTKLEEIVAKNTGKEPFNVPAKQMELIKEKRYGNYQLDSLKTVPVNFMADLDITGGNSGSATLNDKAELTGLVFDGTIDGVISDWAYDPAFTRSIHVDVRYMLWVLDQYASANRILDEMGVKYDKRATH